MGIAAPVDSAPERRRQRQPRGQAERRGFEGDSRIDPLAAHEDRRMNRALTRVLEMCPEPWALLFHASCGLGLLLIAVSLAP
jgi:hypothetical protein